MEEELKKPKPLTERESLLASMRLTLEIEEDVEVMKQDMIEIKQKVNERITLDHGQQAALHHQIKKRIESLSESLDDAEKRTMYSQIHSNLRRAFSTPSYRMVKEMDFNEAMAWVKSWRPLF